MTQSLEQLILDRDEAYKHYEYCLEHYGETDEDTRDAENCYNTLDSQVLWYPTIQSARALSEASADLAQKTLDKVDN